MKDVKLLAGVSLAGMAVAWPAQSCVLSRLAASAYDRALANAWCGGAPHAAWDIAGHAPVCWIGAALIAAAAAMLIASAPTPVREVSRVARYWAV